MSNIKEYIWNFNKLYESAIGTFQFLDCLKRVNIRSVFKKDHRYNCGFQ